MVIKVQRERQLLHEIEGTPAEKKGYNDVGHEDNLIEICDGEEFLGYDMCKDRAINWGKGKPVLAPVQLAMAQPVKT